MTPNDGLLNAVSVLGQELAAQSQQVAELQAALEAALVEGAQLRARVAELEASTDEKGKSLMDLFMNRPPTPEQAAVLDGITEAMHATAAVIEGMPSSRFRSLAMTKLEECSMWAEKAAVFTVGVEGDA